MLHLLITSLRHCAATQERAARLYLRTGEHLASERAARIARDMLARAARYETMLDAPDAA